MRILRLAYAVALIVVSCFGSALATEIGAINNPRLKYEDSRLKFIVEVQNLLNGRLQGSLCAGLYDHDGFVIDVFRIGPKLNLGKDGTQEITYAFPMRQNEFDDLGRIDLYFATFCLNGAGDVLGTPVTVQKPL